MRYRQKVAIMALLLAFTVTNLVATVSAAAPAADKRFIALAVYLDAPQQDWPGFSNLKEKIIETIIAKINTMAVHQIIAGTGVMEKLKDFGIDSLDSAAPNRLTAYGRENKINYIIIFCLRARDFSYSLKAFDVGRGKFLYDGAAHESKATEAAGWSLSDLRLSPTELFMKKVVPTLDEQLSAVMQLLRQ